MTTKLMAVWRRGARGRGKSDSSDAIAVARAALREGFEGDLEHAEDQQEDDRRDH